jgi:enterochelin esterase-like enzyme
MRMDRVRPAVRAALPAIVAALGAWLAGCGAVPATRSPLRAALCAAGTPGAGAPRGAVGDLRLHTFTSRVFGNTRMLRVLVPDGYDRPERRAQRYPVLYLNDGQNLFDSATAVLNPREWRVDETVRALVAAGHIPPLIVVGIDNAGRRGRFREYFPYVDPYLRPPEPDPQGRLYPEFLVDEVIPFIEARYRTRREPEHRGIGGSSAGALAAIYAAVTRPGVFGRLLVESPSLYVDDAHVFRDAAGVRVWPGRIWLGVGTNEGSRPGCRPDAAAEPELVRDVRRFAQLLRAAGVDSSRVRVTVVPCAVHDEVAWGARFPAALTFLFGAER